ncbi:MAG: selenide, water dikinase SelD [Syntrophobacterales bacterium]|nr:selenide, water dikinase SelD [Syntrophobacterales bacterium]
MQSLPRQKHPDLLVGLEAPDDAGVFRLSPELALIQTVDFFTPIVNDPYAFGAIAAANALSDIYAMGGRPLTALSIACFPLKTMPIDDFKAILRGGMDKLHEAGALLLGGHSVEDPELKFGLAVTGVIHPDKILTKGGAQVGDLLILTKPLGTGIIATALKGRLAAPEAEAAMIEVMSGLNRAAAESLEGLKVHAATDITGFGLLGHGLEMAQAGQVEFTIYASRTPALPWARDYADMGLVPAGSHANRNFCAQHLAIDPRVGALDVDLLSDAQTSGGLLIAIAPDNAPELMGRLKARDVRGAAIIGEVTGAGVGRIRVVP